MYYFFIVDKTQGISYILGLQERTAWINMNNTKNLVSSIVYSSPTYRRLTVQLICDQSSSNHFLNVLGEISVGEYVMQLSSPCACWNGCVNPSPHPEPFNWNFSIIIGIAGGAVFLLFLVMISCLFCSKPRRRRHYPVMIINEKTPFIRHY